MDLKDQLSKLFPEHVPQEEEHKPVDADKPDIWMQSEPILCKYEKRKGKAVTILEGYNGADEDLKKLAKLLKSRLSVGGSVKNEQIILQGDYRDKIMNILQDIGFKTKRVGG